MKIKYKSGYKYQLAEDVKVKIGINTAIRVANNYISLDTQGNLAIKAGYSWDGPSGPTFDTKTFMRGSLVHDALYQLMREDKLSQKWREIIDQELRRMCIEDGMWKARAWWVYKGVRFGGLKSASAENRKKIYEAP